MKVIVGLGNPTPKYANTRHNIGAMTVDRLCRQWGISLERRNRYVSSGKGGSRALRSLWRSPAPS